MIATGLMLSLVLAMQPAADAREGQDDFTTYREIVTALSWNCCGPFRSGFPAGLTRRIEAVQSALGQRHGRDAVRAADEAARADFNEEFGTYDPAPTRPTRGDLWQARRELRRWYDARLDRLEARLGIARR